MRKQLFILSCFLLSIAVNAQEGKIHSIKVLGIDQYPSDYYLDILVNIQYKNVGEGSALFLYVDNAPLKKVNLINHAYSQLYMRCAAATKLVANQPEKTATYRFKVWLDPTRLKGGESSTFYIGCFMKYVWESQSFFGSDTHEQLLDIIEPITYEASTGKITTYHHELPKFQSSEAEERRLARISKQTEKETANMLAGFLGALAYVATDDACRECGGSGCEYCNYSGRSKAVQNAMKRGVRDGYNMTTSGKKNTANTNTTIRDGYHTITYENGKYQGYFKDGVRSGKGTYAFKDGSKYVGEWRNGMRNGKGTFTTSTKYKYVGDWVNDQMSGDGTLTLPDGAYYTGDFWADRIYGYGTFYLPTDKIFMKGYYENNRLINLITDGEYVPPIKQTTPKRKPTNTIAKVKNNKK